MGWGFCTYVEIYQGKYEGQIMYVDGELHLEARDGDRPIEEWPADEFVERSIDQGRYMPIASSFDGLLAEYEKLA